MSTDTATDTAEKTGTDYLLSGLTHDALGAQEDLPEPTVKQRGRGSTIVYPGLTAEQVETLNGRVSALIEANKGAAYVGPAKWDLERNTPGYVKPGKAAKPAKEEAEDALL